MLATHTSPQSHTLPNTTNLPPSSPTKPTHFAIKSNNVFLPDHHEPLEAIILIQDQKIFDVVLPAQTNPPTLALIEKEWNIKDYGDLFIFPGLIDSNVHLHANHNTEWENIIYSTELAAAGGVTTIIDNPVMTRAYKSGEDYVKSIEERIKIIKDSSKVDFGIYGLLEPQTEKFVDKILEAGALGLKCYMMSPFQNKLGHYQSETFKNDVLEKLNKDHPDLLLLIHPEMATERELYLSSPCRNVELELRTQKAHMIKSIEFGGGANKGSYVEDMASKKQESDDDGLDDDDQSTINFNSPTKLKGKIKRVKMSLDTNDIVHSELASYSFEKNNGQDNNTDGSNSDLEVMAFEKPITNKSHTLPVGTKPSGMQEIQIFKRTSEVKKEEDNHTEGHKEAENIQKISSSPPKKPLLLNPEMVKPEDLQMTQIQLQTSKELNHLGSIEIKVLSEIPEELDREESRDPHLLTPSISEVYKKLSSQGSTSDPHLLTPSISEAYKKLSSQGSHPDISTIELHFKEQEKSLNVERNISASDKESTLRKESAQEPQEETPVVIRPKKQGRARFRTIDEGNEEETNTEKPSNSPPVLLQEQTEPEITPFEFPIKTGPRHYSEDLCYRDRSDDLVNRRIINPELVTLMTTSPMINLHREGSFLGDNTEDDQKSKCASLDTNLLLDRSPTGLDDSPFGHARSLNISPVGRKASTPSNSGLLQRRMNSRKSSAQCDSTTSSLSSPTGDFKKLSGLNISRASKGCSSNESKYNQSYRIFLANRPQSWEENAVSLVLGALNKETRLRIMFQNLSLASSFLKIRTKNKSEEAPVEKVIGDCGPSYLFFNEKMVNKGETKYKASPPFRSRDNKKLLVEMLRLGGMDILSSYQFFVPARFKLVDDGNFRRAFSGLDCMGCSLQAAWTSSYTYQRKNNKEFNENPEEQKKVINEILRRIYEAMCSNPARVLKIGQRKGRIEKGMDADFVVWDPFNIDNNNQLHPNHVFSGRKLLGVVHKTYLRGNLIYSKDENEEIERGCVPEFIRS